MDDARFDALYPTSIRLASRRFFTPIAVARRVASLFDGQGARRVLDVGSGAGKLALVAAQAAPWIDFVGVEQRPRLVAAARRVAVRLGVPNVTFFVGDAVEAARGDFDGYYLFNPFAENLYAREARLDGRVDLGQARFIHDAHRMAAALAGAREGAAVVTYNGAGVPIPASYDLARTEDTGDDCVRLWVKSRRADEGAFFVETTESAVRIEAADAHRLLGARS